MNRIAHSVGSLGALVGLSLGLGGCVVAPPRPVIVSPPTVAVYPRPYEDRVVVRPTYRYDHDRHERWYRTNRDRRWNRDRDRHYDHDHDHDHDDR